MNGRNDVGALIAAPEAAARDRVRRPAGDVLAVEADAAGAGLQLARQEVDERGLAGAVRADDAVHLVGREARGVTSSTATSPPKRRVRPSTASVLAELRPLRSRGARSGRPGGACAFAGRVSFEQPGDAARRRQHRADQDEAERQRPVVGDRADQARGLQHLFEEGVEDRAEDRPEQRADAAQHHHHDGDAGLPPAEQVGRHVAVDGGEQRAGEARRPRRR